MEEDVTRTVVKHPVGAGLRLTRQKSMEVDKVLGDNSQEMQLMDLDLLDVDPNDFNPNDDDLLNPAMNYMSSSDVTSSGK